jgi:ATP-binding cassette subfamily F protein 3
VRFNFPNPDKIGSPMITIDNADVGYDDGPAVLKRVHASIDIDDRIALLGANGNGKSTMMKLVAGELAARGGHLSRSGKLRIGYFSQHQTDQLNVDSTPYLEMLALMRRKNPDVTEPAARAKLGAFGFSRELADNRIGSLSGGERARLLFAFMSFDAPHLLLLDEPTNHLDIEAREALVQALNAYTGAVIIVSHDPIMVERVADRLLLIKDGACIAFDGDLEDYRKFTIQARREERREGREKKAKEAANDTPAAPVAPAAPRKADAKKLKQAEKEIARLGREKETLEARMADPGFYSAGGPQIAETQQAYDRICKALEEQETVWFEAQEA